MITVEASNVLCAEDTLERGGDYFSEEKDNQDHVHCEESMEGGGVYFQKRTTNKTTVSDCKEICRT